jgi:hypothetical protein
MLLTSVLHAPSLKECAENVFRTRIDHYVHIKLCVSRVVQQ